MKFDVELVGKIGSMALIDKESNILDYTLIARLSSELKPGYIWVTSGAAETGRLDYIKRNGRELKGSPEDIKTDYAAQGQSILMSTYRQYVDPKYSLRQILVEHQHFNDDEKREHLKATLLRCTEQNAIPIINYNDAVSTEESRRFEIQSLKNKNKKVVECVDNDETATQIACLVRAKNLLILTSADGIYKDSKNPDTLIEEISGKDVYEVLSNITECENYCNGASRAGANGARAKLEYVKEAVKIGTNVTIASAKYSIKDILSGKAKATRIGVR
ncbi:MAG: uridylate kinase [Clostridia bacterium]|nr:uridylate kinase [Clostridia bacterium]MBR2449321.1 uridylate kinase [Clostridia bacterium]